MSDFEYLSESSLSSYRDGSSGNEADPEGEEFVKMLLKRLQTCWNALLHICLSQRKTMFLA